MCKKESPVKILAVFLLSGFLLLSIGVAAQTEYCSISPALQGLLVDGVRRFASVSSAVDYLANYHNCLDLKVLKLEGKVETDIKFLNMRTDSTESDIFLLTDRLEKAERDLRTARTEIDTLKMQYDHLEHYVTLLTSPAPRRPVSNPKTPVSKPQAPGNKPKPVVDSPK